MKKIIITSFILYCLSPLSISAQTKHNLSPSDFYNWIDVADPQVSPDGQWAAYTVTTTDSVKDKTNTDIWMVSWDGKNTVQLTNSNEDETMPRFSPDNKYITFLSSRYADKDEENDASQLWLLDRRGGEAQKITNIKQDIEDYSFSPDGKNILLVMWDEDYSDTASTDIRKPYVINRYHFKEDIYGYLDNRHKHLYLLNIESEDITQLTSGNYDESDASFSPDGSKIIFISNHTADPDRNENTDIFIMDARANAAAKQLTTWPGVDHDPHFSPDGKSICYLQSSSSENFTMYGHDYLTVISADGGTPKYLSQNTDKPVMNPRWSKDGKNIAALMENDREQNVVLFDIVSGKNTTLAHGMNVFYNLELNQANGQWLVSMQDPYTPNEIYALENGVPRQLTYHTSAFTDAVNKINITPFTSTSKDGTTVSNILYTPAYAKPGDKLPLIMYIHGGPVAQDDYEYDLYRNMMAANGYAVAIVNYRGSSGRGVNFIRSIFGDWGNKEVMDILGACDYLVQHNMVDSSRIGIMGWSYGGILTDYCIASDTKFKAAASGAGSALQLSMYGIDEYVTQYENELGPPWKNTEKWMKLSYPFFQVEKIKTPVLYMASQSDFNVPVAGSEQMYQALRSIGIPTELVIYPNQFHEIEVPSYLKDRFERYIAWFDKYLK